MVNFIRRWVRDRRHQRVKQLPDPPMPTLQGQQSRRPLTATPCSPSAVAGSAFFQCLPFEIRRHILIDAFGEFPMRFDLRLLYPPLKMKHLAKNDERPGHANLAPDSERDITKPRQWQWCSSVCHENTPKAQPNGPNYFLYELNKYAWDGYFLRCDDWPGEVPTKCLIGAMGWLLACRQAYIEGVEVLYGTNRIFIDDAHVFSRLPDLLLPSRRAMIRSIQLDWDVLPCIPSPRPIYKGSPPIGANRERFISLLTALPAILPNLQFLYLSLNGTDGKQYGPDAKTIVFSEYDEYILNATEEVLGMVDEMLVKLCRLRHCQIYIPSSYLRARKFKEKGIGFEPIHRIKHEPLWRDIVSQVMSGQGGDDECMLKGYWILPGHHDWYHPDDYFPEVVPCFF